METYRKRLFHDFQNIFRVKVKIVKIKLVENSKIGIPLQVQVERNGTVSQFLVKPAPLPVKRGN